MGELIERNFSEKSTDPIKEFHKKLRRKFDLERDVLLFPLLSQITPSKFDALSDNLFQAIVFQNNNVLNRIIKDTNPRDLMEIIESESFKMSMSTLLDNRGAMKNLNLGIKKFYKNFKRRLDRKIKMLQKT